MSPFEPLGLLTRVVLFAAVLTIVGAAAFRFAVLPRWLTAAAAGDPLGAAALRCAASVGLAAALLALLAVGARLPLQLRDLADPELPLGPQARNLILRSLWGRAWLAQVGAALLAALALAAARGGSRRGWMAAAIAALALAITPAFAGHAIGSERYTTVAVAADAAHVLAAGAWIGGIVALAGVLALPRAHGTPEAAGPLVSAFSRLALGMAAITAVTGLFGAWLHGPPLPQLPSHGYGRALLVKLAAVGVVMWLGAFNWRRAGPRLLRDHDERPLARSIRAELAVAALVVLATAVLVVTPPFGEE